MLRIVFYSLLRSLALLGVFCLNLQPVAQGVERATNGIDLASLICAPSGQLPSAELLAAAKLFADLTDSPTKPAPEEAEQCTDCLSADPVALNTPKRSPEQAPQVFTQIRFALYQPGFTHKANGPPVGCRAPPESI